MRNTNKNESEQTSTLTDEDSIHNFPKKIQTMASDPPPIYDPLNNDPPPYMTPWGLGGRRVGHIRGGVGDELTNRSAIALFNWLSGCSSLEVPISPLQNSNSSLLTK